MTFPIVLSHYQAAPLLKARLKTGEACPVSLDLNLSRVESRIEVSGARLPDGTLLSWELLEMISSAESSCFRMEGEAIHKIQVYSEEADQVFSLYPTSNAPTMLISGIPMHRIKDTDPHADTLEKIRAAHPVVGEVLDTATGLGYTAIEAARSSLHVTTIELEPAAQEICRQNPWSQGLFNNPKISQVIGDSFDVVEALKGASFPVILRGPPVFKLAGHLYSADFYRQLYRLLRRGGRLFHYIGDPESKSGQSVTGGVIRRLQDAGFSRIVRQPRAFGVTAVKQC
jgi:uncharacterized protein